MWRVANGLDNAVLVGSILYILFTLLILKKKKTIQWLLFAQKEFNLKATKPAASTTKKRPT